MGIDIMEAQRRGMTIEQAKRDAERLQNRTSAPGKGVVDPSTLPAGSSSRRACRLSGGASDAEGG